MYSPEAIIIEPYSNRYMKAKQAAKIRAVTTVLFAIICSLVTCWFTVHHFDGICMTDQRIAEVLRGSND